MNILKATFDFEKWLALQLPLVKRDLSAKHAHMAEAPFSFFRATFYRWLQLWPEICTNLAKLPKFSESAICTSKFWNLARRRRPPDLGR